MVWSEDDIRERLHKIRSEIATIALDLRTQIAALSQAVAEGRVVRVEGMRRLDHLEKDLASLEALVAQKGEQHARDIGDLENRIANRTIGFLITIIVIVVPALITLLVKLSDLASQVRQGS